MTNLIFFAMKKYLIFLLLLLAAVPLRAQSPSGHFEWVKNYSGIGIGSSYGGNEILNSVVDSMDNIYVLGQFTYGAEIDGVELYPDCFAPTDLQGSIVAKFSPSGDLLWHKIISSDKNGCYAHGMCMVGDSSVMVAVDAWLPYDYGSWTNHNYLYYLDTLLTNEGEPIPVDSVVGKSIAFITFDFDGKVTEQHFLHLGFMDSTGTAVTRGRMTLTNDDRVNGVSWGCDNLVVDHSGNIYITRYVSGDLNVVGNRLTIENGGIGAEMFWVDGMRALVRPVSPTRLWNIEILKFSPHFDSLLGGVFVWDIPDTLREQYSISSYSNHFIIDAHDNLYYAIGGKFFPQSLRLNNSDTLIYHVEQPDYGTYCVIQYNSDLVPTNIAQLSWIDTSEQIATIGIDNPYIDEDSHSLFFSGCSGAGLRQPGCLYRGDTLMLKRNAYWMCVDPTDFSFKSYAYAHTETKTDYSYRLRGRVLVAKNNRVFFQFRYWGNLSFADTMINRAESDVGMGFGIWDYEGNEINYEDYHTYARTNQTGPIYVSDSLVYLTGTLFSDATFGSHIAHNTSNDQAFIAKYVDTAFMHPYIRPDLREQQAIAWEQELRFVLADSPVVLTATASSGLPVAYRVEDSTVARAEGVTLHLLREGSTTVTATQPGDEHYRPAAPVTLPLTVTVGGQGEGIAVPDDALVTVYPNPAHNTLYVDAHDQPIASAMLVSAVGHRFPVSVVSNTIDLSPYPSGVYYLQIVTNKSISQIKIIKR